MNKANHNGHNNKYMFLFFVINDFAKQHKHKVFALNLYKNTHIQILKSITQHSDTHENKHINQTQ